jgi:hypothetical protein
MSVGNTMDREIFTNQQWGLLHNYGLMSTVAPSIMNPQGQIDFVPFPAMMG